MWKSHVKPRRALSTHVKTELTEAKTFRTSFKEHLGGLLYDRKASSLIIGDQNTLFDLIRDISGIVKRKS